MGNPIDTVHRFCAAWSDNVSPAELVAFLIHGAVYHKWYGND
jgi:hypothetical protein